MKRICLIVFLLWNATAFSQDSFLETFNLQNRGQALFMRQTEDRGFFLVGNDLVTGDVFYTKTDSLGNIEFSKIIAASESCSINDMITVNGICHARCSPTRIVHSDRYSRQGLPRRRRKTTVLQETRGHAVSHGETDLQGHGGHAQRRYGAPAERPYNRSGSHPPSRCLRRRSPERRWNAIYSRILLIQLTFRHFIRKISRLVSSTP